MQGRYLGQLVPDMDVTDARGDKIGTVAQVYRYDLAAVGSTRGDSRLPHELPHEEVLEVKTGLFELGKHFFVPLSAIQDVTGGCVFLSRSREEIEELGWDEKPAHLAELR
jgi:hypothetical protein